MTLHSDPIAANPDAVDALVITLAPGVAEQECAPRGAGPVAGEGSRASPM